MVRQIEFYGMLGRSAGDAGGLQPIRRLAPHAKVLINGETGTGKELVARAIHSHAPRSDKPFVTVNCAAVVDDAVRERAVRARARRVHRRRPTRSRAVRGRRRGHAVPGRDRRVAARACRPSCCGCSRTARSSGSARSQRRKVDVRVIAATNRDLLAEVAPGRFREDLYYRLRVIALGCRRCGSGARTSRS